MKRTARPKSRYMIMVRNTDTNQSKTAGYMEFEDETEMQSVIYLVANKLHLDEPPILGSKE